MLHRVRSGQGALLAVAVLCACGIVTVVAGQEAAPAGSGTENSVYTGAYEVQPSGYLPLPGTSWLVMPQYNGLTSDETGKDVIEVDPRITLVLRDEAKSFWPVISKMSTGDAIRLRDDLDRVIKQKLAEAK